MKMWTLLFPSWCVGGVLARTRSPFAKTHATNRVASDSSYDAVDAYVQEQMRRLNIPGVSLAIVRGSKIVHLRGFGVDRPGGQAPSPETPFVLGSLTKSFTALAVMQLVEGGKVELDAPIRRYLPWFRVADPVVSAQITVRHLLNQTSGLPMLPGMMLLADLDNRPDAAERQARGLSALELTRPVGSAFEYSNLNYNLLGLVIQAASGEAYPDYIQNQIFNPLEMSHSYTSQAVAQQNGLAVGYRYWFASPVPVTHLPLPRGSQASGQLISSAQDMAHYLTAFLNEGRYGDAQILSPAGIAELQRGAAALLVMGRSVARYGMGWFVENIGPTKVVCHGGNVPDYSSFMALLPGQKKGIVLLANADNYGLPPIMMEVGLSVAALLAGQKPPVLKLGLIPIAMRALSLVPLAQIVGAALTLRQVRRWRREPMSRPGRGRMWCAHILLPLIPNLLSAAAPLFLRFRRMDSYLRLYNPDLYWTTLLCGGFAALWAFFRTGLILRSLRESPQRAQAKSVPLRADFLEVTNDNYSHS